MAHPSKQAAEARKELRMLNTVPAESNKNRLLSCGIQLNPVHHSHASVVTMAVAVMSKMKYLESPELKKHLLKGVVTTGRILGKGAFGKVVELQLAGTRYAGKQLHDILLGFDNQGVGSIVQKFVEECCLMAEVKHPNIVQFMGICIVEDSDHPVLVMEYLDMSLDHFLQQRQGHIPLSLKYRILLDIARGLLHLHHHDPVIIHRDITSRNILLNKASLQAKIADLGNALMTNPKHLMNTLSSVPGTALYMPPEACTAKPTYDSSLDMFSFGHLALYVMTEEFPCDLLPATYADPKTEKVKANSEVKRRQKYLCILYNNLHKDHNISKMIESCLSNTPKKRPTAQTVLEVLEDEIGGLEDPYSTMEDACKLDLITLAQNAEESTLTRSNLLGSQSTTITQPQLSMSRVQEIKDGVPCLLNIYRRRGGLIPGRSGQMEWKEYVFKVQDRQLTYYRSSKPSKILDQVNLEKVLSVSPFASSENHRFTFVVSFEAELPKSKLSAGSPAGPWLLSAYTAEARLNWMEALKPGSVADLYERKELLAAKIDSKDHDEDAIDKCTEEGAPTLWLPSKDHLVCPIHTCNSDKPLTTSSPLELYVPVLPQKDDGACSIGTDNKTAVSNLDEEMDMPANKSNEGSKSSASLFSSTSGNSEQGFDERDSDPYVDPDDLNIQAENNYDEVPDKDIPPPLPARSQSPQPPHTTEQGFDERDSDPYVDLDDPDMQVESNSDEVPGEDIPPLPARSQSPQPPHTAEQGFDERDSDPYVDLDDLDMQVENNSDEVPDEDIPPPLPARSQSPQPPHTVEHCRPACLDLDPKGFGASQRLASSPQQLQFRRKSIATCSSHLQVPENMHKTNASPVMARSPTGQRASLPLPLSISLPAMPTPMPSPIPPQKSYVNAESLPAPAVAATHSVPEMQHMLTTLLKILNMSSGTSISEHLPVDPIEDDSTYEDINTHVGLVLPNEGPQVLASETQMATVKPPVPKPRKKKPHQQPETTLGILHEQTKDMQNPLKMLVDDEDEEIYTPRPDWAKAATDVAPALKEPEIVLNASLHALRQQALYIPRAQIESMETIGQGQFGQVYKAEYKRRPGVTVAVAVKTIKKYTSQKAHDDFIKEMGIMAHLVHPNVIKLYGLVQEDTESPWIVLEYLENGDLRKFLQNHHRPVPTLVKYMLDVAMGMHYIADKGLVHRDIAARNIIVGSSESRRKAETCKISDFGLLREIPKDGSIYVSKTGGPLPIRWMAPECLKSKEFSTASDVWSYGVLLWEMRNPKRVPYEGVENYEYLSHVLDGLRLDIPDEYSEIVKRIMTACWQKEPSKRPSFLIISTFLSDEVEFEK